MQDQELDAVIKLEIMGEDGKTRSWDAFDDSYGRIMAY